LQTVLPPHVGGLDLTRLTRGNPPHGIPGQQQFSIADDRLGARDCRDDVNLADLALVIDHHARRRYPAKLLDGVLILLFLSLTFPQRDRHLPPSVVSDEKLGVRHSRICTRSLFPGLAGGSSLAVSLRAHPESRASPPKQDAPNMAQHINDSSIL
jgi:hypothetical protein